jgi:hypothetical protein
MSLEVIDLQRGELRAAQGGREAGARASSEAVARCYRQDRQSGARYLPSWACGARLTTSTRRFSGAFKSDGFFGFDLP